MDIIGNSINSDYNKVNYGDSFVVEQFVDGQWIKVNDFEGEVNFHMPLYTLGPLSSKEISYPISIYSTFDDVGDFRIVIKVIAGEDQYTLYYTDCLDTFNISASCS